MNFQKKSSIEIAKEICDLFDELGFTSEYPVDSNELCGKIVQIIEDGNNILHELKGEPLELQNVNLMESECGCCNLTPDPFERQPGE